MANAVKWGPSKSQQWLKVHTGLSLCWFSLWPQLALSLGLFSLMLLPSMGLDAGTLSGVSKAIYGLWVVTAVALGAGMVQMLAMPAGWPGKTAVLVALVLEVATLGAVGLAFSGSHEGLVAAEFARPAALIALMVAFQRLGTTVGAADASWHAKVAMWLVVLEVILLALGLTGDKLGLPSATAFVLDLVSITMQITALAVFMWIAARDLRRAVGPVAHGSTVAVSHAAG